VERDVLPQMDGRSTCTVQRGVARSRCRRLALLLTGVVLSIAGATSSAFAAKELPDASFGSSPSEPVAGQPVQFVSYGCDPDGGPTEQAWDLDADGIFDDSFGPSASRPFTSGSKTVGLRVTDNEGRVVIRRRTLDVAPGRPDYVLPRPSRTPLLSPFPIVRAAGSLSFAGVRFRRLTVRAPICSRITVRCRGQGCPVRRSTRVMGRQAMRFRAFERILAPGTVLEVLVKKRDRIGKYTRFLVREGRPPARRDLCLRFDANRGTPCPRD
jgi:hypothetical protein